MAAVLVGTLQGRRNLLKSGGSQLAFSMPLEVFHTVQNCQETIKSKHLNHFYICCTVLWSKLRNARNFFLKICPFVQIAVEKMRLFKMHRIIKPTCPSRQLFIKITFAFMSVFDFLVKIAIFGAFLFRSRDLRHELLPETNARSRQ